MGTIDGYDRGNAEELRDNLGEWFETHDIDDYRDFDELVKCILDYFTVRESCSSDNTASYFTCDKAYRNALGRVIRPVARKYVKKHYPDYRL